MEREALRALLEEVRRGELDPEAALRRLNHLPFVETANARVDTHRALRHGLPEVVLGLGKTPEQVVEIAESLRRAEQPVLVTRVEPAAAEAILARLPGGVDEAPGRLLWFGPAEVPVVGRGTIAVVTAGTVRPSRRRGGDRRGAPLRATRSSRSTTSASPGSTACSHDRRDAARGARADRGGRHGGGAALRWWPGSSTGR